MTTYAQGAGYIGNLEVLDIYPKQADIILNSLLQFTNEHGEIDLFEFFGSMSEASELEDNGFITPCLVDYAEPIEYTGYINNGEVGIYSQELSAEQMDSDIVTVPAVDYDDLRHKERIKRVQS